MAQTKKKRKRKHRGTQGGKVDASRRARPRTREEAKARAKSGRSKPARGRGDKPPTWRSATIRGVIAAVLFVVLLFLIFGETLVQSLAFGVFMLAFYIPAGFYIDQWAWRRRERARMRGRSGGR